jgi:mono/diheme cytochrome c family protein
MAVQRTEYTMVLKLALICSLSLIVLSCGSGKAEVEVREKQEKELEPMTPDEAKNLFILHCESCHGIDGKKQLSGAADLSVSTKTDAEMLQTILKGNDKGMMPYDDLLTKREETGLVEFVKTLQQNK